MKVLLVVPALLVLIGCSSTSTTAPSTASAPTVTQPAPAFFTDVTGPSEESGDCGGYAFWLYEQEGRFKSGEAAEFEGGCGIYEKRIVDIQHDPKTGKIVFFADSSDPRQWLKFEGKVADGTLTGTINHIDAKTKKPVLLPKPARQIRKFARTDYQTFRQALPQNIKK